MKINIAALALTIASSSLVYAQEEVKKYEPISFDSGSDKVVPFNNKTRKFNDWSISFGGGIPLVQSADMTSINNGNGRRNIGYSFYVSIDKAFTHAFGVSLQYDRGETKQSNSSGAIKGRTEFDAISLLGDINFSNLFRRVDNKSPYRWAFHGYAGVGLLAYKASRKNIREARYELQNEVKPFTTGSIAFQAGAGVKYKISRKLDLGLRAMYVLTHTDSFDGGGDQYSRINMTEEQNSDNFFNFNLGLTYKIGRHASHLMWHDPMQEIYYKLDNVPVVDMEVCKNGDNDNDGVCDDWDKQLDTPAGARVDGSGIALDADLDGVIDLYDKCVTVPGPASNHGCPEEPVMVDNSVVAKNVEIALKDILFIFDKTEIRPESYSKLDMAAEYIKASNGGTFLLVGHTDKKGNDLYNLNLSKGRARAVVVELEKRGVSADQLKSIGVGEQFAMVPETASNEERLQDRKVTVRFVSGDEWNSMPKSDIVETKKAPVKKKVVKKKK